MRGSNHHQGQRLILSSCGGLTLIEVLASLVLLAALLTALLTARGDYLRQWHAAERKQQAVEAADALVRGWWEAPQSIPRQQTGELEGGLRWRTRVIESGPLAALEAAHVRVEIFEPTDRASESVLTAIELVVPAPDPDPDQPQ